MKIRSFLHSQSRDTEVLDSVSLTVPDQSLSVRDIITRFTRGQITIPPVEQGDSESLDDAHEFSDFVDIADAISDGNSALSSLRQQSLSQVDSAPPSSDADGSPSGE